MEQNYFVDIPDVVSVSKISDIRPTGDLSSVILYKEAFNNFEEDVLRSNSHHLEKERMPAHWSAEHLPDSDSFDYICRVFRERLPLLDDLKGVVSFSGDSIALVGGGSSLKKGNYSDDIDSYKIILRMNHPYLEEYFQYTGTKTTVHFINERRCYELVSGSPVSGFSPQGILNVFSGTTNETAALLEYARYLDNDGDPSQYFVLKPSFRKTIDIFHGDEMNPSLGFISVCFSLRVYENIHLYGYDMGQGDGTNYHGRNKIHPAHDPVKEALSFLDCESSLNGFHIYR